MNDTLNTDSTFIIYNKNIKFSINYKYKKYLKYKM